MRFKGKDVEDREIASLRKELEMVLSGLKFSLVDLVVSKQKGSVQIRVVIYNGGRIGTEDCSRVHRAITPRLELAFEQQDINLEVSSPGIDRLIKDGAEFRHYIGKVVRCYRTDISDWTAGVLESSDENGIVIKLNEEAVRQPVRQPVRLGFDIIAKAKLDGAYFNERCQDSAQEV